MVAHNFLANPGTNGLFHYNNQQRPSTNAFFFRSAITSPQFFEISARSLDIGTPVVMRFLCVNPE